MHFKWSIGIDQLAFVYSCSAWAGGQFSLGYLYGFQLSTKHERNASFRFAGEFSPKFRNLRNSAHVWFQLLGSKHLPQTEWTSQQHLIKDCCFGEPTLVEVDEWSISSVVWILRPQVKTLFWFHPKFPPNQTKLVCPECPRLVGLQFINSCWVKIIAKKKQKFEFQIFVPRSTTPTPFSHPHPSSDICLWRSFGQFYCRPSFKSWLSMLLRFTFVVSYEFFQVKIKRTNVIFSWRK